MAKYKEDNLDPVESAQPAAPVIIPDHELTRLIGTGSYGQVWLARNTLGTYRAVKIVYEKTFRHKRPFEREYNGVKKFEPISRLHDGLVDVLQVGRNDAAGYFYCVMELADDVEAGQKIDPAHYNPRTLAHDVTRLKKLPIQDCRNIGATIAGSLHFLHSHGLIHRDVKPSNIVFVRGVPKLADIGLVAEVSEARSYVGTEGFIPPEGPGTAQSDIYSLGKVLYEISTGKDRHDYPELPTRWGDSTEDRELVELNKVVLKACRSDPAQRYKSAQVMAADLLRLGATVPGQSTARYPRPWAADVRALGISAVLVFLVCLIYVYNKNGRALTKPADTVQIASAPRAIAVPEGVVGWWSGEGDASDRTGLYDGVLMNGTSFEPGKVGRAFSFDGVDDYVKIPIGDGLNVKRTTVEFWMKVNPRNSMKNFQGLVTSDFYLVEISCGYGPPAMGVNFVISTDGGKTVSPESFPDTATGNSGGAAVPAGRWCHVAATFDGRKLQLYLDGLPWRDPTYQYGSISPALPESFLTIGAEDGRKTWREVLGPRYFKGLIDEVTIYNRALAAEEIKAIYDADLAGKTIPARLAEKQP
jgi:hypothetical protein